MASGLWVGCQCGTAWSVIHRKDCLDVGGGVDQNEHEKWLTNTGSLPAVMGLLLMGTRQWRNSFVSLALSTKQRYDYSWQDCFMNQSVSSQERHLGQLRLPGNTKYAHITPSCLQFGTQATEEAFWLLWYVNTWCRFLIMGWGKWYISHM